MIRQEVPARLKEGQQKVFLSPKGYRAGANRGEFLGDGLSVNRCLNSAIWVGG